MYIIFETLPGNDPRLDSRMIQYGDFWHYSVYEIPHIPEDPIYLKWLDHEELDPEIAECYKLTSSTTGELSLSGPAKDITEVQGASDTYGSKWIYQCSLQDHANTVKFMQAAVRLHMKQYLKNKEAEPALLQEMKRCVSIDQMQDWMATYMDIRFTGNAGKKLKKTVDAQFSMGELQLPAGAS